MLYLDDQLESSKLLCHKVLELKPHHFGAVCGLVEICIKSDDRSGAVGALQMLREVHPQAAEIMMDTAEKRWIRVEQMSHDLVKDDTGAIN